MKIKIQDLHNWDKNPRGVKKDDFQRLKRLILKLGIFKPFVITEDGTVLGGNMRLLATKELIADGKLDIMEVPVVVVDAPTEEKKIEYALADNDRVGYYEDQALAELLQDMDINLDDYKVDMGIPISLKELMSQFAPDIVEDEPPAVEDTSVSKLGEVYQLGRHRLMCGDAGKIEDLIRLMDGKRGQMVFTDPPYYVDYVGGTSQRGTDKERRILNDKMSSSQFYDFLYAFCSNLMTCVDGAFYICMSSSELHNLWKAFTDAGGHWQTYVIWAKDAFTMSRSDYQHQFEPIMYGLVEDAVNKAMNEVDEDKLPIMYGWSRHSWYGGRKQGDVWRFDRPKVSREHPTMKPIALCAKAIQNSSLRGDIVVDVFGGSGSTLIACEQTDRTCFMMELDPKYCDVIRKRYAKFIGKEDEWETITPLINNQ